MSDLNSGDAKSRKRGQPIPLQGGHRESTHGKGGGNQGVLGRGCDLGKWVNQRVFRLKHTVSTHKELELSIKKKECGVC